MGMRRGRNSTAKFEFQPFSKKQKQLLTWWMPESPYYHYDMIICDGAIRSGKTVSMITSFITWSLSTFNNENFIIAGRSMGALKRNVLEPMFKILTAQGLSYKYVRTENPHIVVGSNMYYLFGASTEASQDTLQGLTAAGAYADEAAVMPQSFINQMIGRCSVEGSRVWLNCNPSGAYHWIKTDLIDLANEKQILRLHFTMEDNLTLSEDIKNRYRRMFRGVFYQRYILGQWVMAEGIIYDAFENDTMVVDQLPKMVRYWVGCDYGTSNATTFILCGIGVDGRLYVIDEYYHSGAQSGRSKTPSQYSKEFINWLSVRNNGIRPEFIFVDPSAEGFILTLFHDGVRGVVQADNSVNIGIELLSNLMSDDRFRVHRRCENVLKELGSYVWDSKAQQIGVDKPLKQNDHTLDPLRYIVNGTRQSWLKLLRDGR